MTGHEYRNVPQYNAIYNVDICPGSMDITVLYKLEREKNNSSIINKFNTSHFDTLLRFNYINDHANKDMYQTLFNKGGGYSILS